jgi:cellulose synthase/poly-beta-1,6-N-acetylglucosamine synthase-like glycosyltransferase
MATVPLLFVVGISLTFWSVVALLRRTFQQYAPNRPVPRNRLTARDVAVVIPARNEEMIISAAIRSVLRMVKPGNIHVIADGCDDDTGLIALSWGLNVLEPMPARGKAAGIEAVVREFDLPNRFAVLLIVDADTELDEHYLDVALPLFDDPEVVAVAGYAKTSWRPQELSLMGRLLVAYRTRLYAVMQWVKYAQTWRHTNVTAIVPGFASMYRTSVLADMDLNPPGLVIEDFNMTFELHRKRLGKIAFRPDVGATTQDPDNLPDYYRQITRWQLGLWQTVRRHGLWPSWFCVALAAFLLEVVVASLLLLALAAGLILAPLADLAAGQVAWGWVASTDGILDSYLTVPGLLLLVVLPDYLLTCVTAVAMRRPSLLFYGLGFLPIRVIDATALLRTLPMAWRTRSSGLWQSPGRRPTPASAPPPRPAADTVGVPPPRSPARSPAPAPAPAGGEAA